MTQSQQNNQAQSEDTQVHYIAVIAGDGIGKEVTPVAQQVLEYAIQGVAKFEFTPFDLGAERYLRDGAILPDDELEALKSYDAILLGAIGDPRIQAGILERGLLLKLRFAFDQYVNLRPSKLYKGVTSPLSKPGDIDFVVVREGTEGLYCGAGGSVRKGTPAEVATEVSINTAYGVERVVRYAFDLAMKRRKHITLVHKKNVLVNAGDMWQRIVARVGEEYPEVTHDYCHIDAATIYMVTEPSRFDVILTDNLFGDILTDEAGAVVGGVGYSASGCINASGEFPSMFEPIHGSAPDIAGRGIANPTAAVLSAAMMLRHLGYDEIAQRIEAAVEADIEQLGSTPRSTEQVGRDIIARLA
ncbi:3-isopropylmalate dehydrogenase [Galliscardovia ingluviei]|uniref:3-isopropylmalate dehydrogenase n=1 Tax=Galliscardovia ingluviei TaxID=1769422 RepID=A0A8J3AJU5_9BIFI|nr:3-isopropylmalate dehydrogenase [Galliscardovia ingluviei]GGI14145.1 3-isopropylmalate dehydrogenase [Galliscardovia ingluviei]